MPFVITITGPSGSGKSTTIHYFEECNSDTFKPKMIPKFTTRPVHHDDKGEVICVPILPNDCDVVYEHYGLRYGLRLNDVYHHFSEGYSPLIILNDIRAVEDIRNVFKGLVRSVFIFRERPSRELYEELGEKRGMDQIEIERRHLKAKDIYRIYIENIYLFDHVIINSGSLNDLKTQTKEIVDGLSFKQYWPLTLRKKE